MKNNKEKIKQIIMISFSFLLIMFGFLNYKISNNNEEKVEVASRSNEATLGDVEFVNSEAVDYEEEISEGIVSNDEIENTYENFSKVDDNYFEETKIERDKMYSETIETYQRLINSNSIAPEQKGIAVQEITNITNIKNSIMISENLIKNKGFENAVVMVNSGKINVVVKYPKLSKEQVSQIQNIIEREFNTSIENINISCK